MLQETVSRLAELPLGIISLGRIIILNEQTNQVIGKPVCRKKTRVRVYSMIKYKINEICHLYMLTSLYGVSRDDIK